MDGGTNGLGMRTAKFTTARTVGEVASLQKKTLRQNKGMGDTGIVRDFCLLLPHRAKRDVEYKETYALISHEWLTLSAEGDLTEAFLSSEIH